MPEREPTKPATRSRSAWGLGALVALLGVVLVVLVENAPSPLERGAAVPGFAVPRLDDRQLVSLEDLRGRVVLLNFWATWCKPCEDEMPAMERLYRALREEGFELLAISVDDPAPDGTFTNVAAFRDRLGISFPIALDPDERVSRLYQTTGYPESLLIDREGRLVERYVGPRQWDSPIYVDRIRRLIRDGV